jgi:chemotaxis protein methyltransferase CheR
MPFDAESLGLNPGAVRLLRDLISDRLGMYFADGRLDALADRVAPFVAEHGFGSFLEYFYLLKYDAAADAEWDRLMDALSVAETYFWREVDQLQAIVNRVVPALAARSSRPIRFWSVPCATGEEPLTLAMLLDSAGWFGRVPIEIRAGDASPAALARARAGRYRERAFRSLPPSYRERYFQRCGEAWQVDAALQARVRAWQQVNLMDERDLAQIGTADVLFCRNVFIYFSDDAVRRVVRAVGDAMPVPGYLCVGASESLLRVTNRFDLEEIDSAFVYVKRGSSSESHR